MSRTIEDVQQYLKTVAGRQGFNSWMNPNVVTAEADVLELEVDVRPEMTQHHGYVHGGIVTAFADTAAAWSAALASLEDVVTSNFTVHLMAPAMGNKLKAVAKPVKVGRSNVTVSVNVYSVNEDQQEKLCATILSAIAVVRDRGGKL